MEINPEQVNNRRFVRGMLLVWIPILVVNLPTVVFILREMSNQKATGLGAVAGGLSEAFANFGIIGFFFCEIMAIVLLVRSLSRKRPARVFFTVISICVSGFVVLAVGAALVFLIGHSRH